MSNSTTRPTRRDLILLGVASLLFIGHALLYTAWVEDDAYITFQYGRNLVAGHGLVFNPGERVEGYSNFAWVGVSAAADFVGVDPLPVAQTLGVLGGLCAVLCSWVLARRLTASWGGDRSSLSLMAPFFLAVSPVLPRHAVTGLETSAYAGLLTAALCLFSAKGSRAWLLTILLLALALLRPEGVAFALLILVWRVVRRQSESWPRFLGFIVVFGAYYLWRSWWFGTPVTNTFFFKMTGGESAVVDGLVYCREFLRDTCGTILIGFNLWFLVTRRKSALAWLIAVMVGGQLVLVILAGGDWMHHYRFFAPVLPALAAMSAAALAGLSFATAAHPYRRMAIGVMVAVLVMSTAAMVRIEVDIAQQVLPSVRADGYLTQAYKRLGLWLNENTPPKATVAISDVGAVGYYSERPIVDMFGLIDSHIAQQPGRLHFKSDAAYVLARKPDYVVLVAGRDHLGRDGYLRVPDRALAATNDFLRLYREDHRMPIDYRREEIVVYQRLSP